MKKSLLALAVLGAFAGTAFAQTSVTVYGVVDAGVAFESGGAAGSVAKLATGVQSGNRLGFKGTEDLGNGLKANFQLENGFNLDDGTQRQGALFGRQAWVGLSGGFGAVNLGRQYTPIFIALDSIDPFGTGLTGASTNLFGTNWSDVRVNNSITYSTPAMGGFSANVQYGLGEQAGNTGGNRNLGFSVGYANGPVNAVLAYYNQNNLTNSDNAKSTFLGGSYNFGPATAHLAYEKATGTGNFDQANWLAGVTVPFGASAVFADYIRKNDKSGPNLNASQFAIGYTYAMSKRTNFYTSYGRINNDSLASYMVGDASSGGSKPAAGGNSGSLAIGIRHTF